MGIVKKIDFDTGQIAVNNDFTTIFHVVKMHCEIVYLWGVIKRVLHVSTAGRKIHLHVTNLNQVLALNDVIDMNEIKFRYKTVINLRFIKITI
jgi:hypothetical protein